MRRDRQQLAKAFGLALREEREKAGLSQEELAFRSRVDRTFVSRAECGERQPALTTVFRLASALGVTPNALVARTEKHLQRQTHSTS